jgi:hypothetical protein
LTRASTTASHLGAGTLDTANLSGGLVNEPELGKPLRVFLDNGRVVETTAIQRIVRTGSQWLIATRNSLYQLVFQGPLTA